MGRGYMPRQDGRALGWMVNFLAAVGSDVGRYHVTPPEMEAVGAAVAAFKEAYRWTGTRGQRSPVRVVRKDEARRLAEAACRGLYGRIKHDERVTDQAKVSAGVTPVGRVGGRRVGKPKVAPVLAVRWITPGRQVLTYAERLGSGRRAKPAGVASLQLFRAVTEEKVTDPGATAYYDSFTRTPMRVKFEPGDGGKVATYFARWATAKGRVGPWSEGVSMRIAA